MLNIITLLYHFCFGLIIIYNNIGNIIEKACPNIWLESNQPLNPFFNASAYSYVKDDVPDTIAIKYKLKYNKNVPKTAYFVTFIKRFLSS